MFIIKSQVKPFDIASNIMIVLLAQTIASSVKHDVYKNISNLYLSIDPNLF